MRVRQRSLLRDLDYGRYSGALLADVQKERPEMVRQWREHPHTVHFDGGESLGDLRRRIQRFVGEIVERHPDGTVLAATHDSPVRVAASLALGLDDAEHNRDSLKAPLASLTLFEVEDGRLKLIIHNDYSHLRGIDGAG
jgi:broad specificity phosphatase PhoE